jgi:hypothetical protein
MPTAAEIVEDLRAAANGALAVAVFWHVILLGIGVALALGWRPPPRSAGRLLAAPLASVALVAIAFRNPFNAIAFSLLAIAVFLAADRHSVKAVRPVSTTATAVGLLMLGMAWVYPHFLEAPDWVYFYAAPLGVVPCATLYAAIGFALIGAISRLAGNILAGAGLFFGIFGLLKLGVRLDLGLVIGAGALVALRRPLELVASRRPA